MDHNVPSAITVGLRIRGVDVVTAYEDGRHQADDSSLLNRAGELGRALFTRDDDLVIEAVLRQQANMPFPGVIYAHQMRLSIGATIRDLELIAKAGTLEDLASIILFLPL
jgi:hypothetical protein